MLSVYNLIDIKVKEWCNLILNNDNSILSEVINHIDGQGKMRTPQKEAIKVYLWLKFCANNKKISSIIRGGLLQDEDRAKEYENYYTFKNNRVMLFLNQFSQDNNLINLHRMLVKDPNGDIYNWDDFLDQLFYNYTYTNYLFSLPMGAGKTFLMAAFIYLDLYFAMLYPKDKRFAHNFVIFAPHASKTAILPSLKTIRDFNPDWILPSEIAKILKQKLHVEILDSLKSNRKDKLQGSNLNLERVNRLTQTQDYGLVFITNAEKVVLENFDEAMLYYQQKDSIFYDEKKEDNINKTNELREKLSKVPFLCVMLDEVHHAYGNTNNGQKKLRQAINILNQYKNIVNVIGFSGTPYVKTNIDISGLKINLNQIQDMVYTFSLADGIGSFLKVPNIKKVDVRDSIIIRDALSEFFNFYDITYSNGTKSKIAFYCPSIPKLNEEIMPIIIDWYKKNRPGKEAEIFRFYSKVDKKNKEYELPNDSLSIYHNLDKSYSTKRVILLVAIGTEGWDCKSLTSVVLPRLKTTKNFVLQTSCRCLREVVNAKEEKALIYLNKENYEILDDELKTVYNLSIQDLKLKKDYNINVVIRKPNLGIVKYQQTYKKYKLIKVKQDNLKSELNKFNMKEIKQKYKYNDRVFLATIGKSGIVGEHELDIINWEVDLTYSFIDFIYDISRLSYGKYQEGQLIDLYENELKGIYNKIMKDIKWIQANPRLEFNEVINMVTALLMEEIKMESEIIQEDAELELLEWQISEPTIPYDNKYLMPAMPKIKIAEYKKRPNRFMEDFEDSKIDYMDISFNYIPYKMDSQFEVNALMEMLKVAELKGLEVYYNGYKDKNLNSFKIKTELGYYTPDFLVLKRETSDKEERGSIEKILIIETKGMTFYNDEFRLKEDYVKTIFLKDNPNFKYVCYIDSEGKNDFTKHLDDLRIKIESL